MEKIPVSEFKNLIGECVNQVAYAKKRYILQRHSKDVAGLVSAEDARKLENISSWKGDENLGKMYDNDREMLADLMKKTGAKDLTEFLYGCDFPPITKAIKENIKDTRKLNSKN